jgi:hypothetical protein
MKPKSAYLLLCIAGAVIPYWQFVAWIAQHGMNLRLLVQELFANRISAFFGLDVIISAVVVILFASVERRWIKLWWLPIIAVLSVGVSLGLPLLLYLREVQGAQLSSQAAAG